MMKHVLLTNDDGIHAPGLRALCDAFLSGGWRVTVSAPDQERSAASHSITIKRPIVVRTAVWEGIPEGAPLMLWMSDGTPSDAVKLALRSLCCEDAPDIVVSGINNGWNIGTDVHYSGTVGAAMEAAFEGVAAVAVSVHEPDAERLCNAASVAERFSTRLLKDPLPMPSVLNINLPNCAPEEIRGIVEAPLTCISYADAYDKLEHTRGRSAYWLSGEIIEEGCLPGGDLDRLLQRYATVTAIGWDLTMRGHCERFLQDL